MPVASSEQRQDQIYCAEQINIPVTFPSILKDYAKAAIRTQPYDLLHWTAAYFRALANGQFPPVKERLEYPPRVHPSGMTPRFLKILLNQFRHDDRVDIEKVAGWVEVELESLLARWRGIALKDESLYRILMTGRLLQTPGAPEVCDLYRFLAVGCGLLGNNLLETMILVCELLTKEADGGSAMISFKVFMNLYEYLAELDCSGGQSIVPPGGSKLEAELERDEVSPIRSSQSASSSSTISSSTVTDDASTKRSRASRCQSTDSSAEDAGEFLDSSRESRDESSEESRKNVPLRGKKASDPTESSTTRETRAREGLAESRNAHSDTKTRSALKVSESGERRADEVTRVQEERRDVEFHSREENVRSASVDGTPALTESRSDSRRATWSPSSSGKSHVPAVKVTEAVPGENSRQVDRPDKILEARSGRLSGGADVHGDPAEDPIENIPREDSRNIDEDRETPGGKVANFHDGRHAEKMTFEDDRALFGEDEFEVGQGEKTGGIRTDSADYESFAGEYDDMAEYETIGLENVLRGFCECLDGKETRDFESPDETEERPEPLDPVPEFLGRMLLSECSDGLYFLKEVPGIGPPVCSATVTAVGLWLAECSRRQQGQVGPRNLKHFMCPDLDGEFRREESSKSSCPESCCIDQ